MRLFPDARVVCCVRDVGWIMDSVERLVRRNAFELSGMFGFEPGNTVFTRVNRLAKRERAGRLRAGRVEGGFLRRTGEPGDPGRI
jgi:hypothetical protein